MSSLLLDFPTKKFKSHKKVLRFATMTQVRFYEGPDDGGNDTMFYSSQDYKAMRIANKRAINEAHRKCLSYMTSNSRTNLGDIYSDLTGIENFATPDLVRFSINEKEQYVNAVLDEQERQDHSSEFDPIKLAQVAKDQTRRAAKRAHMIGLVHARNASEIK